jgi:hypothetical protein
LAIAKALPVEESKEILLQEQMDDFRYNQLIVMNDCDAKYTDRSIKEMMR